MGKAKINRNWSLVRRNLTKTPLRMIECPLSIIPKHYHISYTLSYHIQEIIKAQLKVVVTLR